MTDQNDARVEVIQGDRQQAAQMLRAIGFINGREFDAILRGTWDAREEVQSFARHRIASAATARGEAVEECARVADHFCANAYSPGMSEEICMARSYVASDVASAIRSLAPARDEVGLR